MASLLDLEYVLRSKQEQLTLQEANILLTWRAKAMRDYTIGACGSSIVTWLATKRLSLFFRVSLLCGASFACGIWSFRNSVESSIDHILSLEGTRIQRELANILLQRHGHDNPRVSKCFYREEVYDDSTADRPIYRWRFRNFFGDPATRSQDTEETDSPDAAVKKTTTATRTTTAPKLANVIAANGPLENPFDIIFGLPGIDEMVSLPHTPNAPSRRQARREKRAHRRRRKCHHDEEESDI